MTKQGVINFDDMLSYSYIKYLPKYALKIVLQLLMTNPTKF